MHPHELRHTAASLAIAADADVKVVPQMLGHKPAAMTLDLHGRLFPDRLHEVAEQLGTGPRDAGTGPGAEVGPARAVGGSRGSSPWGK